MRVTLSFSVLPAPIPSPAFPRLPELLRAFDTLAPLRSALLETLPRARLMLPPVSYLRPV